jgi:hypothetical protein
LLQLWKLKCQGKSWGPESGCRWYYRKIGMDVDYRTNFFKWEVQQVWMQFLQIFLQPMSPVISKLWGQLGIQENSARFNLPEQFLLSLWLLEA